MKHFLLLFALLLSCGLQAQTFQADKAYSDLEKTGMSLAQEQLDGYNARDIEAFLQPYAEDVEVYTFPNQLSYKGKDTMRERYARMFASTPDLHCKLYSRTAHGNHVIDHEEVLKNGEIIYAVAIYEISNGKISKVYFLPK